MWFVHAKLPIGRWTCVRIIDPHGENGSNPLLTLTLTIITPMQIQNKQASTPHHVHFTMQPPSKITVCKMYSCQYLPMKIIKSKRVAYATKYLIFSFLIPVWRYAVLGCRSLPGGHLALSSRSSASSHCLLSCSVVVLVEQVVQVVQAVALNRKRNRINNYITLKILHIFKMQLQHYCH